MNQKENRPNNKSLSLSLPLLSSPGKEIGTTTKLQKNSIISIFSKTEDKTEDETEDETEDKTGIEEEERNDLLFSCCWEWIPEQPKEGNKFPIRVFIIISQEDHHHLKEGDFSSFLLLLLYIIFLFWNQEEEFFTWRTRKK